MNGTLGRDKLWNQQIWSDIDKAVQDEVGRIRVAQKVLPAVVYPNGQPVPDDELSYPPGGEAPADKQVPQRISEGKTKAFMEIWREFWLTQSQVDCEENLHVGRTLARMAAKALALAEDALLFQGKQMEEPLKKVGIRLKNPYSAGDGLLGVAKNKLDVTNWSTNPAEIFRSVVNGISKLVDVGEPGPYALFLPPEIYAYTFAPLANFPATVGDRISALVAGGFFATNGLTNPDLRDLKGLLVSLAGEPTTICIGVDAITAFTQTDPQGEHCFRVFERIQYVAREANAFVRLEFGKSAAEKEAAVKVEDAKVKAAKAVEEMVQAATQAAQAATRAAKAAEKAAQAAMKPRNAPEPEKEKPNESPLSS
jgi:uncharacterized linocin/CFP29 family protein